LIISQKAEAWAAVAFLVATMCLLLIAILQYYKAEKYEALNRTTKKIYILIFAWCLCTAGILW
jgi:hypothetical protein